MRLIRIPNTKKLSSGYWKVPIKISEIDDVNIEWLHTNAVKPKDSFDYEELETNPIFDVSKSLPKSNIAVKEYGTAPMLNDYICIQRIMENIPYGFESDESSDCIAQSGFLPPPSKSDSVPVVVVVVVVVVV